jgi:hypothetical protein
MRGQHGFGFVDRGRKRRGEGRCLEVIPAQRASRYVAKYLSPLDGDGKPTLSETVTRPDVPPLVAYVSRSLTGETGMTMRYLRWRRMAYVLKLPAIVPSTGELVSSVIERGQRDEIRRWLALERAELGAG